MKHEDNFRKQLARFFMIFGIIILILGLYSCNISFNLVDEIQKIRKH